MSRFWTIVLLGIVFAGMGLEFGLPRSLAVEPKPAKKPVGKPEVKPDAPGGFVVPFADPQAFFDTMFGDDKTDEAALAKVELSLKEEKQFGDQAAEAFLKQLAADKVKVVSKGKDVKYLERLLATLRPHLKAPGRYRTFTVYLAEAPHTDARCFPGGTVLVFRGLLDFAENEAALIGILGHELSHLDRGHQSNQLKRMKQASQAFSDKGGFSPERFMSAGAGLMKMFMKPFRPEDETEADLDGATWAYRAGYDVREMAALFLRLHERDKVGKEALPGFFRTHPFHIDRYRAILARYDELQTTQPRDELYVGRENLAKRMAKDDKAFAE